MEQNRGFAVLGPGGVGGFLAAMLAYGGEPVVVLAGDDTLRAIAAGGLRQENRRFGDFGVSVATASRLAHPVDACFVTVKATQLEAALERVPAPRSAADWWSRFSTASITSIVCARSTRGRASSRRRSASRPCG